MQHIDIILQLNDKRVAFLTDLLALGLIWTLLRDRSLTDLDLLIGYDPLDLGILTNLCFISG